MMEEAVERAAKVAIADAEIVRVAPEAADVGLMTYWDFWLGYVKTLFMPVVAPRMTSTHHDVFFSDKQEGYEPTAALLLCGVPEESLR
jgi:hypothetical protein